MNAIDICDHLADLYNKDKSLKEEQESEGKNRIDAEIAELQEFRSLGQRFIYIDTFVTVIEISGVYSAGHMRVAHRLATGEIAHHVFTVHDLPLLKILNPE